MMPAAQVRDTRTPKGLIHPQMQQPVELERDGQTLRGMTYRPDTAGGSRRVPCVVLLHGFTGSRAEAGFLFVKLARALNARGIGAVCFDFMHSGESDGSFDQMLVSGEIADAMRITEWLGGVSWVDRSRLGLLGFSLGGLVAACTVARTRLYRSLVLLAPTTSENLARHADATQAGHAPVVVGPHTLHPRFSEDLATIQPEADVVLHPRPTLLVQGDADTAVPPEVSDAFVAAMRRADVPLTTHPIAGANHTFNTPGHQREVIATVGDFLRQTLGG